MANLSKEQLSNIVDDVAQEWGKESTIRSLNLQKITILRAYLNLFMMHCYLCRKIKIEMPKKSSMIKLMKLNLF